LDWERLRSFAAQLFQGVPESKTAGQSNEAEAKGQLEGNALWLMKGQVGADYRFFRTENETRSLHHYVYSLVEEKLSDNKSVLLINNEFDFGNWTENYFRDGQFVLAKGLVRFMEYEWVSMMLEALPEMYRTLTHMESIGLKASQAAPQELAAKRKEREDRLKEFKALKLDQITALFRQLYGDIVRIKVVPNKTHKDKMLVGTGLPENFHDTAASISQKYGYEVDAKWVVFGQINTSAVSDEPSPMPIGNAMEDLFEQVALMVSQVNRMATAMKFPSVSFTPISIYREC
jgi:hypothetical protein